MVSSEKEIAERYAMLCTMNKSEIIGILLCSNECERNTCVGCPIQKEMED